MLIAFETIAGSTLSGTDGVVGTVNDLLFDSEQWIVRYVVVDTGKWLPGRRVLLPASVLGPADWKQHAFTVPLTRQAVEDSPDVDTQRPVSRQQEAKLMSHYSVPYYWGPAGVALVGSGPGTVPLQAHNSPLQAGGSDADASGLRSAEEVKGYYIHATDGDIGHVEEFVIDDESWAVQYIVVDTKNWLPGRSVLISPHWIGSISWADATVRANMTREEIKGSPEYDPHSPVNRDYEERLHDYYGRPSYW